VTTGAGSVVGIAVVGAKVVGAAVVVGGRVVGATVVGAAVVATVVGASVVVTDVVVGAEVAGSVLDGAELAGCVLTGTVLEATLDGDVEEATTDVEGTVLSPIATWPSSSSLAHQISPAIKRNNSAKPTTITAARGPGSSYHFLGGVTSGAGAIASAGMCCVGGLGITGISPVIGPVGGGGVLGITCVGSEGGIGPSDIGTINGSSAVGSSENGSRGAPESLTDEPYPRTSPA